MIRIRRAAERGHFDYAWLLNTYHNVFVHRGIATRST